MIRSQGAWVASLTAEGRLQITEGVGEVRVVVQVRDGAREICLPNSLEQPEVVNLRGDMVHRLADAVWWTAGLVALLEADGSHISGLDVHVLEDLTVDRSQVRKVVRAVTQKIGSLTEFDNTCFD